MGLPVLLAGLVILAAADAFGGVTRTVALIGADRSLHGAGAGIAMAGVVAVIMERRPQPQAPNEGRRVLAGRWAAFMVAGLATAPELMRHRVASGNWVVALQPFPWLTGAALGLGALYALLTEGTATVSARLPLPAARTGPAGPARGPGRGNPPDRPGCHLPGRPGHRRGRVANALALAGLAAVTARTATAARFAVICAATVFTRGPVRGCDDRAGPVHRGLRDHALSRPGAARGWPWWRGSRRPGP